MSPLLHCKKLYCPKLSGYSYMKNKQLEMIEMIQSIAKVISREVYLKKVQNGERKLFEIEKHKVIDGMVASGDGEEKRSYFIFDGGINEFIEIDIQESYELVTQKLGGTEDKLISKKIDKLVQTARINDILNNFFDAMEEKS